LSTKPLLQLALDYIDLSPALAMAFLLRDEVEIIEIGTPLTKAEGMRAVSTIHHLCPNNIILADVKTPDVGGLEAQICFDAGADWMTVLGAAPLATVRLALAEANRRPGKEAVIELTGVRDILSRAQEWRDMGMERLVYHRGWDEGNTARTWDPADWETIRILINMGFKVTVAGGIDLEIIPFFKGLDISVFNIGRAIRETADPVPATRNIRALIDELWPEHIGAKVI
jgi:3-hexulose-6-phosphate synthase